MTGTTAASRAGGEVAVEALVDRALAAGGDLVRVHLSLPLPLSLGEEEDSHTGLGTRVSCRRQGRLEPGGGRWRSGEGSSKGGVSRRCARRGPTPACGTL